MAMADIAVRQQYNVIAPQPRAGPTTWSRHARRCAP